MSNPAHSSEPSEELKTSGYAGNVRTTVLQNTGEKELTLIYDPSTTYIVEKGKSRPLETSDEDILVNAAGKTLSTINYPDSSACLVKKGKQIEGAKFTLTITVSSD